MAENIRIIRLRGGEDIVADCLEDENTLLLDSPMHLIFKRGPAGNKVMLLLPWLPVELIDENIASVKYDDIVTTVVPRKEFVDYYLESASIINQQMTFVPKFTEDQDDFQDNLLNDLVEQALEEKKTSNIH